MKPGLKGFKYYLEKPTPYNAEVDVSKLFRSSGFVAAGDNAMVVNSIIMSRGIKTSPVPDSSRDAPEFLKGKHYQ